MPYVKWVVDGVDVVPGMTPPIGKNVLVLKNIQRSENYTCQAASKLQLIENTTLVRVQSLPSAPSGLRVSDITPTSVKLTWQYGNNGGMRRLSGRGPPSEYFAIQYKPRAASWDYKEISGVVSDFYDIRGLSPYTEYEFVVLAVNDVGRGPKSQAVLATTGETESGSVDLSEYYYNNAPQNNRF